MPISLKKNVNHIKISLDVTLQGISLQKKLQIYKHIETMQLNMRF